MIFSRPDDSQVASLAGVFQSAILVNQLANKPDHDSGALRSSALSILRTEAETVIEVYASWHDLRLGLETLRQVFQGKTGHASRDIFQYAVGMHQIATRLETLISVTNLVYTGLVEINNRYPDADVMDDNIDEEEWLYEDIAALYSKTISTITPRIMVRGSEGRLNEARTVNQVRTALFAGIRSAWLWQQLGGRRWHLIVHKNAYQSIASRLLQY